MTVFVFPGQGSQFKGMGAEVFQSFPALVAQADSILGYSIENLCLEDPEGKLSQTHYTQPALYVVNALSYYQKKHEGITPQFVAGHSLGEYNALLAAEVFDFATGLRLVQKRGALMNQATEGAMAAIVGLGAQEITQLLNQAGNKEVVVANFNSYTQVVISGLKSAVEKIQPLFEQAGAMFIPLKVSGAFHLPWMQSAKEIFSDFISSFQFNTPKIPVIANVDAQYYTLEKIKENLASQITGSVHWSSTIKYLLEKGEEQFEEIGPGKVLTGLIQRIKQGK